MNQTFLGINILLLKKMQEIWLRLSQLLFLAAEARSSNTSAYLSAAVFTMFFSSLHDVEFIAAFSSQIF